MKARHYTIMDKVKQWSEIKRRKRLRKECWKVQKPQNYIHWTTRAQDVIKHMTQNLKHGEHQQIHACFLHSQHAIFWWLSSCCDVSIDKYTQCLTQQFTSLQDSYIVLVHYITNARLSHTQKGTQTKRTISFVPLLHQLVNVTYIQPSYF
jgi:hypothetical protein